MHFPFLFFVTVAVLTMLFVEAWVQRKASWSLPAAFIYVTVLAWYCADLIITPEDYDFISDQALNFSYAQVLAFLVTYRVLTPQVSARLAAGAADATLQDALKPETLLVGVIVLWSLLLSWGVIRVDGDVFAALFPVESRAGVNMWAREAGVGAGSGGFLVSIASYLYVLVCGSFGMLLFFVRSPAARAAALGTIVVSWPYFLLSGSRNIFLAVSMPCFFAYLLFAQQRLLVRIGFLFVAFVALNSAFLVVGSFRSTGLTEYLAAERAGELSGAGIKHYGLNMIQELCYVNDFVSVSGPSYGSHYGAELMNVVPRVLLPDKPLIGIDYAMWRGFSGGDSDLGVVATISSGMIGGGVLNFGRFFGPVAVAVLMALWTGLLVRWWTQRASPLRCCLFLAALGQTFNLGRDITLLVLWPVVFAYVIVRVLERLGSRRRRQLATSSRFQAGVNGAQT